ncbi:nucleotidyl cyclase domain-containing protein [Nitrincola tapanii]|uniref:GGDEF domain-containing protein n=1 Tax=Nitrincola tapanii TaxID=1708751 RepID=A0A5A9W5G2_9GAMM|nr:GGDEF domain-containing protein [Nitrincola tapanii]KAA0875892.1 hypothetical protein E1H14_04180 [Nitrincola tapanii]
MFQSLMPYLLAFLLCLSFGLGLYLWKLRQAFQAYRHWAEQEIAQLSPTDTQTGALKADPFLHQLEVECRRAVREFMPLTLMKVHFELLHEAGELSVFTQQSAAILRQKLARPGDQLGQVEANGLAMLLPATNAQAESFAQHCHTHLKEVFANASVQITLVACTFQPSANLNAVYASEKLEALLQEALQSRAGEVHFHAEEIADFSLTYTL